MKPGEKDKGVKVGSKHTPILTPERIKKLKEIEKHNKTKSKKDGGARSSSNSTVKTPTMAQHLKGIKDKGYKVVKNPSGSITITKIKAPVKK